MTGEEVTAQKQAPLAQLARVGVSVWLDDLSRERLRSGSLAEMVRSRAVVGVTTNPAIFRASISEGAAYAPQVRDLGAMRSEVGEAVRALTTYDVRWACDLMHGVHVATGGRDGLVSIEVDPRAADDVAASVAEARALWWQVDRPNVLIKIPATRAGLHAISATLAEGISVNATLIFSLSRYVEVIEAFLEGMERARDNGHDLANINSVASFFVSRVDTEIDVRLEKLGRRDLRGQAAVANARLAYRSYEDMLATARWQTLAAAGARPQRPLWASTGVKDPAYEETRYVVELAAPDTVNTMPEATLNAVADHGVVRGDTVTGSYAEADEVFAQLVEAHVDYDDVVAELESAGVQQFQDAWSELLETLAAQLTTSRTGAVVLT
jgi:transaldolase